MKPFRYALLLGATLLPIAVRAASLDAATSRAWQEYVASAKARMDQRLKPDQTLLWVDEAPDRLARVRRGEVVVSPVSPQKPTRVSSGLIHDWVGAVFIPGLTVSDVLGVTRDYAGYKELYRPTVGASKVLATTSEVKDRFSMLLVNKSSSLKTALDADYESMFVRLDQRRVYSVSSATRIQEIEEYGSPGQHLLREGEGSGLIWRLFSIARYVERDGGVYLEVEAMGLSRDIPGSLRWLVEPMVRRILRASLSTSLKQTEAAVRVRSELARSKTGRGDVIAMPAYLGFLGDFRPIGQP